jgi:hypothetical protein
MTWMIGIWGLKQDSLWKKLGLIPVWDAFGFLIWLTLVLRATASAGAMANTTFAKGSSCP